MVDTLVLTAHPRMEHSRVNRRLMRAVIAQAHPRVQVRDLYALYPDYLVDVVAERALLSTVRRLVWQFPLHWYGLPPLLKLWQDEVFGRGWSHGPGGRALVGKEFWPVLTTGGQAGDYAEGGLHGLPLAQFLAPLRQTAALTGMQLLPPLVLHAAHRVDAATLDAHQARFLWQLTQPFARWAEGM